MKKQFRYAFGEILIVIVGISIAFSMNKCADHSKDTKQRQQYLSSLKRDLEVDKQNLAANVIAIEEKLQGLNEIMPLLNTDAPNKQRIFPVLFRKVAVLTNFTPKDITYQTMINSGDFKLINDFDVKTAIETHYSGYKTILKDYERQEIIHKEYFGPYLIDYADFDAMRRGELGLSNEKRLKNILQSMSGAFSYKKMASERGVISCDSLIGVLDSFIK
ncbi:DUF6090 family protein [Ichthyenterobacterium sp. W332]|uniref:DUF6090 family protein n=1 Tax=Microcosmobacter mediterraneus TaxID=3075607 RepID=A0ABU2YM48_9FLAO|nr:DUF6090 family protein [Ichthyenterobacterium sp. W332]MDT0559233.1 DUF6090 family protein [Ichthyenterobacterium sp. W332]